MALLRHVCVTVLGVLVLARAGTLAGREATVVLPAIEPPRDAGVAVIEVGPTVWVSGDRSDTPHDEVFLGADPADARRLIACSMINVPSGSSIRRYTTVAYVSFDGGQTWRHTRTTQLPTGDPSCGYAADGTTYLLAQASDTPWDREGTWTLEVNRSNDGGRTWEAPSFSGSGDRSWLILDPFSTTVPTPIYVTYQDRVRPLRVDGREPPLGLFLKRSNDRGRTWSEPAVRLGELGHEEVAGVTPQRAVALPDGTIAILYNSPQFTPPPTLPGDLPSRPPLQPRWSSQYVTTSPDGGVTLTDAAKLGDYVSLYGVAGTPGSMASLAVDASNGPFRGRLYAAWIDARSGRAEIVFRYSDDKGATWSPPRTVNDDHAWAPPAFGPDNEMPTLAVNNAGIVALMWYDRRDNPDNVGFYPRIRVSLDGGDTWQPSVRLTDRPSRRPASDLVRLRPQVARWRVEHGRLAVTFRHHWWVSNGHTAGLAADANGAFHALWVDNRTGVNQVYTARVDVTGKAQRYGSEMLAKYEDVTSRVTFEVDDATVDAAVKTITAKLRVRNTSDDTIRGPLVVRVETVTSELGTARVTGAEHDANEGATWTFETPEGGLAPSAATEDRTVSFAMDPVRQLMEGADVRIGLVRIEARVLAPPQ